MDPGWKKLGEGSYNYAEVNYEQGLVFKFQKDAYLTDEPERSVRLWNATNPDLDPPAKLHTMLDGRSGWVCPFVNGEQANDKEISDALIEIFNRTGRVVVDAPSPRNFLKTTPPNSKIVCIDIGQALQMEKREEVFLSDHVRRKSIVSLEAWRDTQGEYTTYFAAPGFKDFSITINTIKALLFIKNNRPDIFDVSFLSKPRLIRSLATAYDFQNANKDSDIVAWALSNLDEVSSTTQPRPAEVASLPATEVVPATAEVVSPPATEVVHPTAEAASPPATEVVPATAEAVSLSSTEVVPAPAEAASPPASEVVPAPAEAASPPAIEIVPVTAEAVSPPATEVVSPATESIFVFQSIPEMASKIEKISFQEEPEAKKNIEIGKNVLKEQRLITLDNIKESCKFELQRYINSRGYIDKEGHFNPSLKTKFFRNTLLTAQKVNAIQRLIDTIDGASSLDEIQTALTQTTASKELTSSQFRSGLEAAVGKCEVIVDVAKIEGLDNELSMTNKT